MLHICERTTIIQVVLNTGPNGPNGWTSADLCVELDLVLFRNRVLVRAGSSSSTNNTQRGGAGCPAPFIGSAVSTFSSVINNVRKWESQIEYSHLLCLECNMIFPNIHCCLSIGSAVYQTALLVP